jgi:hypothetical protein
VPAACSPDQRETEKCEIIVKNPEPDEESSFGEWHWPPRYTKPREGTLLISPLRLGTASAATLLCLL